MNRLRGLLQKKIRITYADNTEVVVPCTISDEKTEMLKYKSNEFLGKDYKVFNILVKDLQENNAPIRNFMFVEYDRIKYQVQAKEINGVFDNTISLIAVIYRKNING